MSTIRITSLPRRASAAAAAEGAVQNQQPPQRLGQPIQPQLLRLSIAKMAMAEMLESNASSPPSRNSSTSSSGLDHRNFPDQNHVNVHTASTSGTRFGSSSDINWQNLSQVEVRISGLPSTSSTWDVYRMVEQYGNVIRISMVGDSNSGQRSKSRQARKTAYVKFQ